MKKQALLIGINQYQILPELKFARQDAEAVEQALKQNYCFSDDEVMLLTDARHGLFKPTNSLIILSHLEKLANQELDLFIFGFWGHGVVRNGKRYLCPLDVMPSAVEKLGVPFDELMNLLSKIRAKNMCLILDCCQKVHDRGEEETLTAADQTAIENAARDIVLRRKKTAPEFQSNVAILNSCKEGQAAYEWDNRKHGIFTAHLLDAMNRRFDSVAQIVGYVSHNVEKTAMELGKTQTPLCRLEGDIPLLVDTKTTPLVTGNVFISYRHCNADLVAPVEEELKKRGISYFIDRVGVNYGMEYSEALTQALKAAKVLLLFWTKDANDSTDLFREVKMALDLKKRVIPYKIGSFNVIEHDSLYYQLSPLSRYEVPAQTPETVKEIVNRVELALKENEVSLSTPSDSMSNLFQVKSKDFNWNKILVALLCLIVVFSAIRLMTNRPDKQSIIAEKDESVVNSSEAYTIPNNQFPIEIPVEKNEPVNNEVKIDNVIQSVKLLENNKDYLVARQKLLMALQEIFSEKLVDLWIQLDTNLCPPSYNYKQTLSVYTPDERTWEEYLLKKYGYNKWNVLDPISMILGKISEAEAKKIQKERFDKEAAKVFGTLDKDSISRTLDIYETLKTSTESLLNYLNYEKLHTNDDNLLRTLSNYSSKVESFKDTVKTQRTKYLSYCVVSPYLADADRWLYLSNEQKEWFLFPQQEALDKAIRVLSFACHDQNLYECNEEVRKQFFEIQKKLKSMVSSTVYEELKYLSALQDSTYPSKKMGADAWWE